MNVERGAAEARSLGRELGRLCASAAGVGAGDPCLWAACVGSSPPSAWNGRALKHTHPTHSRSSSSRFKSGSYRCLLLDGINSNKTRLQDSQEFAEPHHRYKNRLYWQYKSLYWHYKSLYWLVPSANPVFDSLSQTTVVFTPLAMPG